MHLWLSAIKVKVTLAEFRTVFPGALSEHGNGNTAIQPLRTTSPYGGGGNYTKTQAKR